MAGNRGGAGLRQPKYEFPRLPLVLFGIDLILGRRRSFVRDCRTVAEANPYARQVKGLENIPAQGPFILVMNHYGREGLRPYHCGMMVAAIIADRRPTSGHIRWVITSEWYGRRIGPLPIPVWLFRWAFGRVARVYDLVTMPRQESRVMSRAAVLRRITRLLQREPIGLMPEGRGSGTLIEPLEGSGLFVHSLSERGIPLIPGGLWEEGDALIIRFGEPFVFSLPKGVRGQERERLTRELMMVAVGRLLPRQYWGVYAEAIERSLKGARGPS